MKRLLLILALFNSAVMAMDKPYAKELIEEQTELDRKNQLGERLNQELYDSVLTMRRRHNKFFTEGALNSIKNLIAQGADINSIAKYGSYTSLDLAIETENIELIKLLITHGADVNKKNKFVTSPLYYFIQAGGHNLEVMKLLIENGANVDIPDKAGNTTLMLAAKYGLVAAVRLLTNGTFLQKQQPQQLEAISKLQERTYLSLLPVELRQAAFEHLKIKADPNLKNKNGETALNIAIKSLEELLKNANQYPNLYANVDERIRNLEEIINILEPITAKESLQQPQAQKGWWQKLWGRL